MGVTRHIAPHSRTKKVKDKIFYYGGLAKQAIAEKGAESIVNGTIGALLDEDRRLALMPAVEEATNRLNTVEFAPYAPVAGTHEFRADVIDYIYTGITDRPPLGAVATSGATGALRLAIWDFLETGDPVVTHDYFWGPYKAIVTDAERQFVTFQTFTDDDRFNTEAALQTLEKALERRDRALLMVNTPCHNPTGGSIAPADTLALRDGLAALAQANPHKIITFLADAAYWEFGDMNDNRVLLEQFRDLPENLVFCLAFTLSKSLTRYGLRTGALLVAAHDQAVVDDITAVLTTSVRVHWSNTSHIGQKIFSTIYRDSELLVQLRQDQRFFADLCNSRGRQFVAEADACGLRHTPYSGGFFITLPHPDPQAVVERMMEDDLFMVPLAKGVRVALCSIPSVQIGGLAERLAGYLR